jgi:hypothetical protein
MAYTDEDLRLRIARLIDLGWNCDEYLNSTFVDTTIVLESLVHELGHSRIVGAKHLQTPKGMWATNQIVHTRPNPDRDEINATAMTILVCEHYGIDCRTLSLGNVGGNVEEDQIQAPDRAEMALDLKTVQAMARSVVKYIERVAG